MTGFERERARLAWDRAECRGYDTLDRGADGAGTPESPSRR